MKIQISDNITNMYNQKTLTKSSKNSSKKVRKLYKSSKRENIKSSITIVKYSSYVEITISMAVNVIMKRYINISKFRQNNQTYVKTSCIKTYKNKKKRKNIKPQKNRKYQTLSGGRQGQEKVNFIS